MRNTIILLVLFFAPLLAIGQAQDSVKKFVPKGKVEVRIFSNFNYEFSQKKTAFDVTRAYLGYNYNYTENISARAVIDVSKPDIAINGKTVDTISTSLQYMAHLKFAYGVYKTDKFTLSFGMIELGQFKLQDQLWGHRYVMKTIQDEYSFCPSADIGFRGEYKIDSWISSDISMRNGEGFKKQQADNKYWYGIGLTLQPVKSFYYRVFYDYGDNEIVQSNLTNFVCFTSPKFKVGAEYVISNNFKFKEDQKLTGISVFASYQLTKKFEVFGRYDDLSSNTLAGKANAWNYDVDNQSMIFGLQLSPVDNISFSLNGRYQIPENSALDKKTSIFFNVDFKI